MKMTTACGSMRRICFSASKPSCPLTTSRLKFMSSRMRSGQNVRMKCSMRSGLTATLIFLDFLRQRLQQQVEGEEHVFVVVDDEDFSQLFHCIIIDDFLDAD